MPQLDFYSYMSQLTIICIVSFFIYIYLVNILLPTIGITLKIRAYVIENKVNKVKEIVEISNKSQKQIYVILEKIAELLKNIVEKVKEETLSKEVNIIMVKGENLDGLIEEDVEAEFLLQSIKVRMVGVISDSE